MAKQSTVLRAISNVSSCSSKMIMKAAQSGGAFSWHQVLHHCHYGCLPGFMFIVRINQSFCHLICHTPMLWAGLWLLLWEWVANTSLWVGQPSYWPLLQVAMPGYITDSHSRRKSLCHQNPTTKRSDSNKHPEKMGLYRLCLDLIFWEDRWCHHHPRHRY